MNEDYTTHDLLSEYADAAKKLRASQRFRAETLRKIRYQAAMHPETQRVSERRIDDVTDATDLMITGNTASPKPRRKASIKQKMRSLGGIAASVLLLGGMGFFLYRKASNDTEQAKNPAQAPSASVGQSTDTKELTDIRDSADSIIQQYQKEKANFALLYTEIQTNCIQPLYRALNPPDSNTVEILSLSEDLFEHYQLQYNLQTTQMEKLETQLAQCKDVVIYDVFVNSDSTMTIRLANGTDTEVTVSRDCSVTHDGSGMPVTDKATSLETSNLTIPPHSTQYLSLEGFQPGTFAASIKYRFTLYNAGYRINAEDPGTRELTFTHTGEGSTREYIEQIFETPEDDRFDYGFSENLHAEKATLDDVQAYLQKHHNVKGFIKDYEPTYTFSSNLWSFSYYQNEIGPTVRNIWILDSEITSFIEEINGEYRLVQPDLSSAIE